jgi:hypothetical protein
VIAVLLTGAGIVVLILARGRPTTPAEVAVTSLIVVYILTR